MSKMKLKDITAIETELEKVSVLIGHDRLDWNDLLSIDVFRRMVDIAGGDGSKRSSCRWRRTYLLVLLVAILTTLYCRLDSTNRESSRCSLALPYGLENMFVEPVTCDFCRNITNISKLTSLTPQEFAKK